MWFIIRCSRAKCKKEISLLELFFFWLWDSVMMINRRHYLPALIRRWRKQPYWILFSGSASSSDVRGGGVNVLHRRRILRVIFRPTKKLRWRAGGKMSQDCYFPGGRIQLHAPSHGRKVEFDIFWLEGGGIVLTLSENVHQNVSKCAWNFFFLGGWCCRFRAPEIEFMANQHFLK